jgi:hypothetical protein
MKKNVLATCLLATTWLLCSAIHAGAQFVTLSVGGTVTSSDTIALATNDTATVVFLSTVDRSDLSGNSWLEVVHKGTNNINTTNIFSSSYVNRMVLPGTTTGSPYVSHASMPIIAGPATIRMRATGTPNPGMCTLEITKPSSSFVPVNTVVIPNDNGSSVNIILEQSADMINWTAANPGTYGSSSAKRFFRVRAQR